MAEYFQLFFYCTFIANGINLINQDQENIMTGIENDFLEDLKRDDIRSFDRIFEKYYSMLCVYATDILNNRVISEEIVQDVFLKLWNNRSSLVIHTSLKSYLYRSVRNQCLNYIRDHSTQKQIKEISIQDLQSRLILFDFESNTDILDELLSEEMEEALNKAINNLPDQCREIFCLCRFQGKSYSEISEILNISVSSVKTQMLRSMDKLKLLLSNYIS